MIQKNGKVNAEALKKRIKKMKVLNSALKEKLTVSRLKAMKGFEHLSDEMAKAILNQLEEYAKIVLSQMNRMKKRVGYEE